MSGIAGCVRFDGNPVAADETATMNAAMAHRGQDGVGLWQLGGVALGRCLLRLHDHAPSRAPPRQSVDGRFVITFDGRIDNRDELSGQLGLRGMVIDDDLLLEGFRRWGDALPDHLLGEFSFAIWDNIENALFCARDPVGARSVCFHHGREHFLFASEEMAVASALGELPQPDPLYLASLLLRGYYRFDTAQSPLAKIRKLPPGQWLRIHADGRLVMRNYWDWQRQSEAPLRSDDDYQARLRELMCKAVACRLPTLAPATVFLSGGIDSLAVMGSARHLVRNGSARPLHVHSLIRGDAHCLESANLRAMLAGQHGDATLIDATEPWATDGDEAAKALLLQRPRPTDLALAYAHLLAQRARSEGFRAVFTGVSGDMALHTPSDPLAHAIRMRGLVSTLRESTALLQRHSLLQGQGRARLIARALWKQGAPLALQRAWTGLREHHRRQRALAAAGIAPDSAPWTDLASQLDRDTRKWLAACAGTPDHEHRLELETGAIQLGLEGYGQAMALHGLEHLDPWSDVRILRFCLSLPLEQRSRHGWYKYLARCAFEPWLPGTVAWHREKQHLGNLISQRVQCWQRMDAGRLQTSPPAALVHLLGSGGASRLVADTALPRLPAHLAHSALDAITWLAWLEKQ